MDHINIQKNTEQVTNIFKEISMKIAFRTSNFLRKDLEEKQYKSNKYDNSVMFRLKYPDYPQQ